jgi:membrane protein implicated in regulation of membrane protease activity
MMGILLGLWLIFAIYVLVAYFFPPNGIWAIPLSMKFLIGAVILTYIYLAFVIMIIVLLVFTKQVIDNTKGTPVKSYTGETQSFDEYEKP